jgi:hypothetical protein
VPSLYSPPMKFLVLSRESREIGESAWARAAVFQSDLVDTGRLERELSLEDYRYRRDLGAPEGSTVADEYRVLLWRPEMGDLSRGTCVVVGTETWLCADDGMADAVLRMKFLEWRDGMEGMEGMEGMFGSSPPRRCFRDLRGEGSLLPEQFEAWLTAARPLRLQVCPPLLRVALVNGG